MDDFKNEEWIIDTPEDSTGYSSIGTIDGKNVCTLYGGFKRTIPLSKLLLNSKEMFKFISSLENDNNSIPKFMWDKRNELLTKITEK